MNAGYRFDPTFSFFVGPGYYQYAIAPSPSGKNAQLPHTTFTRILRSSFWAALFIPTWSADLAVF
jgi:hypothetical protein